jgi:DNA-binding NarL/FixJ family response regulator
LSAPTRQIFPDVRVGRADDPVAVRTLLADREGAARHALAALLRDLDDVSLVGVVATREDLPGEVRRLRPDVVVIDDRLLNDGRHPLTGIGPTRSQVRVIVVGVDDDPAFAARARQLGAQAWIAKDRADEELPRLLKAA